MAFVVDEVFRFLMLGKTGSGKSTTGNTILGERKFASSLSFASVTTKSDLQRTSKKGQLIEVMDCPGLYDTSKSQAEVAQVVVQAVGGMHPGPHAILYISRLGRYTSEEFGVFERLKALFDDRITDYMIVLFTGGDDLEKEKKHLADLLKDAPKDMVQVIKECGHRCIVFNNTAKDTKPQVDKLLDEVRKMKTKNEDQPHYQCPKYETIGKAMEQEVQRRLAEVTKKDLKGDPYIQELKTKTNEVEAALEDSTAEMHRKERKSKELEKEIEQKEKEQKRLKRKLQAKQEEEEIQIMKEKELQQQLGLQKEELLRQQEEIKREHEKQLKIKDEKLRLEKQKMEKEKEDEKKRQEARDEEMNRLKNEIVENENPGFLEKIINGFRKLGNAVLGLF